MTSGLLFLSWGELCGASAGGSLGILRLRFRHPGAGDAVSVGRLPRVRLFFVLYGELLLLSLLPLLHRCGDSSTLRATW